MVGAESSRKGGKRGRKQQEAATAAALVALRQDQNGGLRISEPDSNVPVVPSSPETPNVSNVNLSNRGKRGKSKARDKGNGTGKGLVEVEFNERSQYLRVSEPDSNAPVVPSSLETPNVRSEDLSNRDKRRKSRASDKGKGKGPIEVEFNERSQSLRISEPDSNALAIPSSPEIPNVRNENLSNTEKRAKSKARDKGKRKGPVEVEFNERGQYVGEYAAEFSSFLGETARRLVPLTVPSWYGDALTDNLKIQIWTHVTTSYIVDERRKKVIFQKMAKLWRDHRCLTLKKVREEIGKVGLKTAATNSKPSNVHSLKEWLKFIKSSMNPVYRAKCEKFKDMRDQKILIHRTSRTSFACIEHDLKKRTDAPEEVIRTNVWLRGYEAKKKSDDDDVEDPEVVKKVKEKVADQANSSHPSIIDDVVSQVLGPERVRGYGCGALPLRRPGQTYPRRVTRLEQEVKDLKMLVERLVGQDQGEKSNANVHVDTSPTPIRGANNNTSTSKKRKQVDEGQGGRFAPPMKNTSTSKKRKQVDEGQVARFGPPMKKVFLLNWFDDEENVVAIADVQSEDPKEKVHCVPLGRGCWKVWVREVFDDIPLYRPTSEFCTLVGAEGSTVAWPTTSITLL